MRIYSLILLIFIFFRSITFGQETTENKDKIYLKNGSRLTGKVIEYSIKDSITFQLDGGQPITFPVALIKKIEMGTGKTKSYTAYNFKENVFYARTQISSLYRKDKSGLSVNQVFGYQYRSWLGVGAGIGIDNYYKEEGNDLMPVFLELRSYLLKQNTSPYVAIRYGYAFAFADEEIGQVEAKGDYFWNPVIGYRLGSGRPFIDVFCGAKFQNASYKSRDGWGELNYDLIYRRYDFGLALTF